MDNAAFMDDFFCQVSVTHCISVHACYFCFFICILYNMLYIYSIYLQFCHLCAFEINTLCVCVFQIEDIRNSIDKIDENVAEVKKLYSVILSAPTSDQSKIP